MSDTLLHHLFIELTHKVLGRLDAIDQKLDLFATTTLNMENKMTAQSDALAAVAANIAANVDTMKSNTAAHDVAVQAELAELARAIAAGPAANDPVIQASIDKLSGLSTSIAQTSDTIAGETAALVASIPQAPAGGA